MTIIVGSRASKLALWQANWVRDRLVTAGHTVEIRTIKTTGDKRADASLAQSGTKGLFIKEIEEALIAREVDVAVHSLKDLPVDQPSGLIVAAVPEREDARDVLIARDGGAFQDLRRGARVATSSLRRQAQLLHRRGDLEVVPIRGNVDTRLRKLDAGECDALVMAAAGIHRLGLARRVTAYFSAGEMCPAVGQGALTIETRTDDRDTRLAVEPLDHPPTRRAVNAERAVLRELGGGCAVPIAAYAVEANSEVRIVGVVASPNGARLIRAEAAAPADDPEGLGRLLARDLQRQGAREILSGALESAAQLTDDPH